MLQAKYDRRLTISTSCGIIEALGHCNELHLVTGTANSGQHAFKQVITRLNSSSADTLASDIFPQSSGCVQELLHGESTRPTGQCVSQPPQVFKRIVSEASVDQHEELMDGVGQSPALSQRLDGRGNLGANPKLNEPSLSWMPAIRPASDPRASTLSGISSLSRPAISAGAPSGAYWSLLQDLSSPASADGSIDYSDSHSRQPKGNISHGNHLFKGALGNDPCSFSDNQIQSDVDNFRRGLDAPILRPGRTMSTKLEGLQDVINKAGTSSQAPDLLQPDKEEGGESGSDCSDDLDEEDVKPAVMTSSRGRKRQYSCGTASKNLVSERKRRKRLNDGLYALRALVPKISKMDKASIVGDAIDYVRELQQQVENLESDISQIESDSLSAGDACPPLPAEKESEVIVHARQSESEAGTSTHTRQSNDSLNERQQRLLQLEISRVDRGAFQLRIFCKQGPGVLVQLMQALEAAGLDVLNANLTCFKESILNTFIAEMKDGEVEEEEVRSAILTKAAQFGLLVDTEN